MEYVKVSDTEFKSVETISQEASYNVSDLISRRDTLLSQIGSCQVELDKINALLSTANGLGISV